MERHNRAVLILDPVVTALISILYDWKREAVKEERKLGKDV